MAALNAALRLLATLSTLFIIVLTAIPATLAAPATPASAAAVPALSANRTLSGLSPARFTPILGPGNPLAEVVLSFNYYQDISCQTLAGSMRITDLELISGTCFALPGNSLIFTYQQHDGPITYYNPKEVNMHNFPYKGCWKPPTGPANDGYMGGLGGCFNTQSIASFQAVWGEG